MHRLQRTGRLDISNVEEPEEELELGDIGTSGEGKEPLEGHASPSSQTLGKDMHRLQRTGRLDISNMEEPEEELELGGIGTSREGKEPLEGHASPSSQTLGKDMHRLQHIGTLDISNVEEPEEELELGSRTAMISGLPTKVGENMRSFLFEVLVSPRIVYLGRLLIPVEAALKYFPSLANRQETYEEKMEITDTQNRDSPMTLKYLGSECFFVMDSNWQSFLLRNPLDGMDVIHFYKPLPVCYNNCYLVELAKQRYPGIIHELNPENFLFELLLTDVDILCKSLFIPTKVVKSHFPAVRIPAKTHHMERLYVTDERNGEWRMKKGCFQGLFRLMMEEFITECHLVEGDTIRFYKADQLSLNLHHFLVGFVKGRADLTESRTAAVDDSKDRGGDREGDDGGGADRGGNRQGDGGGGSSSGGLTRWKFGFGDCCMALKSNARTEES
ncbi:uncharacterized protein LOC131312689 isoform X1 [Rhododendron vialii]|uniref:uncharacterized protein LOC131312689 isoform X1 n=1 Tax=Rhododendron vialii TaxID=182163 RepID=UPI00265F3FDE|nr:uncharacterized protein LOC131312689 isoform X1 [Rhododendron vialii]